MDIKKAVSTAKFPEARESVINIIGKKRYEEYKELFPLFVLCQYRTLVANDLESLIANVQYGDEFVPNGVGLYKRVLHVLGKCFLFPVILLKGCRKSTCSEYNLKMIVVSNTFVNSERYPSTRKVLDATCGYRAILTMRDVIQNGHGSIKQALLKSLKGNRGNYRPIVMVASSVSGTRLKYYTRKWCEIVYEYKNSGVVSEEKIDEILPILKVVYTRRLKRIKKILRNNAIEMYATVNQYNLRDVLLIQACNEMGIRTVQMEHHVMQFSRKNFSENKQIHRYSFAQEYYMWNDSDKKFHEKVFCVDNILEEDSEIKRKVMGNLELTYEDACAAQEKYKMERRITFMTFAIDEVDLNTEEQIKQVKEWRWKIFCGLKELGEKQNVKIRIRYKPYSEMNFREEEIPVLREWGFEISESVPECLLEDICSSMAVMSTTSTVMATARVFDRIVYRIEDPAVSYIKVDPKIIEVKVDDIANIVLPSDRVGNLDREDFFMAERLFQNTLEV